MKNPSHPGRLVKDDLDEMGVSIAATAAAIGVPRQRLHSLIDGRSAMTPDMAVRLEKAIGGTADSWLRMQLNYDLAQLPRLAKSIKVPKKLSRLSKALLEMSDDMRKSGMMTAAVHKRIVRRLTT